MKTDPRRSSDPLRVSGRAPRNLWLHNSVVHSAGIAIVMMAFSVSFTQICIGFAFLFFLGEKLPEIAHFAGGLVRNRPRKRSPAIPLPEEVAIRMKQAGQGRGRLGSLPLPLATGALLFVLLILFAFLHRILSHDYSLGKALTAEPGDLFLYLFGILLYTLAQNPLDRPRLQRYLLIFAGLLVLSGFIAIFSEFRLARIVMGYGFIPSATNRPQHPAFRLGLLHLYRPIGFMDTRLTYGGLLAMVLPWFTLRPLLKKDATKEPGAGPGWSRFSVALAWIGWLVISLNGARSAQGGFLASMALALLVLEKENRFAHLKRFRDFFRGRGGSAVALSVLLLLSSGALLFHVRRGYLLDRAEVRLFRHTDHQRMIIWASTEGLIQSHPILGIGAGTYQKRALEWRDAFVRKHPTTWYFVQNAPSGHAHNDLLHLTAVGGIPAGLLFLFLMFATLRESLRSEGPAPRPPFPSPHSGSGVAKGVDSPQAAETQGVGSAPLTPGKREENPERHAEWIQTGLLLAGSLAFFLGGLFQCYYQDDEVVVFFWALIGFALGWRREIQNRPHRDVSA